MFWILTSNIIWGEDSWVDSWPGLVPAREEGSSRGAAHGTAGVELSEEQSLVGQLLDVGSGGGGVAIRWQVTIAQLDRGKRVMSWEDQIPVIIIADGKAAAESLLNLLLNKFSA